MGNLLYLFVTLVYLVLGVLLIVMTARTKPIKDLTHIWHLIARKEKPGKAIHKFLNIQNDAVMITRVNSLQRLLCMLDPSNPKCKNVHKDTNNMHKETEQFQNLQTCALAVGFILVFLSLFRLLTLLVN